MNSDEVVKVVAKTVAALKESIDGGVYTFKSISKSFPTFLEFGLALRSYISFSDSEKAEVLKQLEDLTGRLNTIEGKMKVGFDELKTFISQYSFYNDVPVVAALLSQALQDTKEGTEKRRQDFREKYHAARPLEYARRLNNQLSKVNTNPLLVLMTANAATGKETFRKWKQIYEGVMSQLCFIEAVACQFIHEGSKYRLEKIELEYKIFKKLLAEWDDEYVTNDYYWPESVREIVEDIQNSGKQMSSSEKAMLIKEELEELDTLDIFTVIVFNQRYEYYANLPNNVVHSAHRGGCSVFVYRSRNAHAAEKEVEKFKRSVIVQSIKPLKYDQEHGFVSRKDLRDKTSSLLRDSGLVVAVLDGSDVAVESTRTDVFKDGVGDGFMGELKCHNPDEKGSPVIPFYLYAVYKH